MMMNMESRMVYDLKSCQTVDDFLTFLSFLSFLVVLMETVWADDDFVLKPSTMAQRHGWGYWTWRFIGKRIMSLQFANL